MLGFCVLQGAKLVFDLIFIFSKIKLIIQKIKICYTFRHNLKRSEFNYCLNMDVMHLNVAVFTDWC